MFIREQNGFSPAVLILLVAGILVAFYAGYVWGFNVGIKETNKTVQQIPTSSPTPGIDTGYQNPFEGVKLNPFR